MNLTSYRNSWQKNLIIRCMVFLMVCIVVAMGVTAYIFLGVNDVFANPNKCPDGQLAKEGCKWVQHQGKGDKQYGKCQWLPIQAVAPPWVEVPLNTCPVLQPPPINTVVVASTTPLPTATSMPNITPTPIMAFTPTLAPTLKNTNTPTLPVIIIPGVTIVPQNDPVGITPFVAITGTPPTCDLCKAEQQKADAQSTVAAVEATRLYLQLLTATAHP